MATLVLVEFKVKPQRANDMTKLLRDLLPGTRAFAGCKSVTGHLSPEDGRTFLLVENWESKEAQQKYMAWRVTTEHGAQLVALADGGLVIRYFDTLDV